MANTLSDVLQSVAAYINQDNTLPTGTDLTMWVDLVNQSQNEWADEYVWRRVLTRTYTPTVNFSQSSIGLPVIFDRLASPVFDKSQTDDNKYYEIMPDERFTKVSTDKYVYRLGDQVTGQYLVINPPLASGASIVFDYIAQPSSLATLNDTITCPSQQFLVLRTVSKILSARSDPRFPQVKADSDDLLATIVETESAPTQGQDNQTPTSYARKGFRIGQQ